MSKFVLTAQVQLQAPKNTRQVVSQIQQQLKGLNVNVNVQGGRKTQQQIQNITKATNKASQAASGLGKTLQTSIRRYAGLAIATRAVTLFTSTLSNAVKEAIAFERELIKVVQVTGRTVNELRGLTSEITRLSTAFGASSTSLINVSRVLSQAGLSARETKIALDALARTTLAPTFDDISQTAEGAIAIFNQFKQGAAALEAQLGAINAVAGQFAVEAGDLIAVIRRTGGVFKAAGGDLNELIALFTSVRATTRESAESIATGLRTIFTRIQRPKTIEFLKQFGVELTDLDGKFVGPFEAIKRLSQALAGLEAGDLSFIKIAEELGGFRQIGKVIPLIQQFSTAQDALNVAIAGSDSLTKDAATAQLALAVRVSRTKEEFIALIREITGTKSFQFIANSALNIASAFLKVADAIKPLIPLIAAFATIKIAKGLGGALGGIKGALGMNRGGTVPGTGNSDTVPAMLTPGEFVIRKSAVQAFGAKNLSNINKYKTGGMAELASLDKRSIKMDDGDTFSALVAPTGKKFRATFRPAGYDAYEIGGKPSRVSPDRLSSLQSLNPDIDFPDPRGTGGGRGIKIKANTKVTSGKTARTAASRGTSQYKRFLKSRLTTEEDLLSQITGTSGGFGRYLIDHGKPPLTPTNVTGRYARRNKGGGISGAGTDTVPALLTPGEFVVNRKSAQAFGYGNLKNINRYATGGKVQRFKNGGEAEGGMSGALGLTLALGSIQALMPVIDENTSAFMRNTNSILEFGTTITAAATGLSELAKAANVSSMFALFGGEGKSAFTSIGQQMGINFGDRLGTSKFGKMAGIQERMGPLREGQGFTSLGDKFGKLGGAIGSVTQAFGAAAIAAAGMYLFVGLLKKLNGVTERLTHSIEDGNVAAAERAAVEAAGFDAAAVTGAAVGGGAVLGFLLGGPIGAAIGAAFGLLIAQVLKPSIEVAKTQAAAQAQAASTAKVLAKAHEDAAKAAQDYTKGNISIAEFMGPAIEAAESAGQARKRGQDAIAASERSSSGEGQVFFMAGQIRQMLGMEKTTASVRREERKAQEARDKDVTKIAMPAVQAQARAMAASGGDFEGFFASLDPAIRQAFDRAGISLEDVFDSIKKDVDRARKQFELLNLGLTNVNAAADASIVALNNLGNFEDLGDNSSIDNALGTLQAGLTAAGAALDPTVFSSAIDTGARALESLGASADQIDKFKESTAGINAAQQAVPAAIKKLKESFDPARDGPLNPQELKQAFADQIAEQMKGIMSEEQIGNLTDLISTADLEQGDIDALNRGDFSPLQKLVDQFGEESLKEFTDAMKKASEIEQKMASILKKRIALENQLADANAKVIAVQLEAAEIIAKAGGPAVTSAQRQQSLIAQSNARTGNLGLTQLRTGSAGEIRRRNFELTERANRIQGTRLNVAAGGDIGRMEGTAMQGEQERLNAAIKEQADLTRALISEKQKELELVKARNAEEKKGLESLISGDFEEFFKSRATQGATAAAALGDQNLMSSFGMAGMGGAVQNLQNMQNAGVQTVFGQQIGGSGGVLENAAAGALSRFGMADQAGVIAGTTDAENAINQEIIALAETLPETAQLEADSAARMLDAANLQMQAAETQLEAVKERLEAAGFAKGGMVYASKGMFVPKGTDTVPAMLTPGEFVVRRSAVQRGNNLSILQSMNSGGSAAKGMSRGGQVKYFDNGGSVGGGGGGMGVSPEVLNSFSASLRDFNTQLANNISNLQNTQFQIKLDTTNINVNLTGTSFINNLTANLKNDIMQYVSEAISKYKVGNDGSLTQDGMEV